MSTDYVKRYYGKINTRIAQVNEKDPFSTSFLSAIGTGDNTLFQKYMIETRVFDGTWVDFIASSIPFIDNIIRNPKSFIKSQSEIVPVELAKRTTAASVRHLAANSRYVKTITEAGEVIPEKILTIFREEDLAIYENRFVKTLIDKLVLFVEKRYATIKRLIGSDYINKFSQASKFEYDNIKIDFEMRLNIEKKITDSEAEIRNQEILNKMEEVRAAILGFASSPFMRDLKSARPVQAPIQKTNILTKDPNYRKCYEVWLFLDSYGKIDYTVETGISEQKASEEYIAKVKELILLSFATVVGNDDSDLGRFATLPTISKRTKKTKVLSDPDLASQEKSMVMESHLINEYYYQEARRLYSKRINEAVIDGEPYHIALKDVYQKAFQITENIFKSLIEIPDDIKNDPVALIRFRMRNQQALNQIFRYKSQDLKKMEKSLASNEKQIAKLKAKLEGKKAPTVKDLAKLSPKEQQKQKLAKEKEKEKEKLLKQKEKEKQKAKEQALKERLREQEKAKAKKLREKEKAKLLAQKEKERQMMQGLSKEERLKLKAKLDAKKAREQEKKAALRASIISQEDQNYVNEKLAKDLAVIEEIKEKDRLQLSYLREKEAIKLAEAKKKEQEKLAEERKKAKAKEQALKEREKAKAKEQALKEREKAKAKEQALKEREKAKEQALKEREKAKEQALREREKEKAKLQIQKEREKEKALLLKQKEKDKEILKKAREKEKALIEKQKAKEKAKLIEARKKEQEKLALQKNKETKKTTKDEALLAPKDEDKV